MKIAIISDLHIGKTQYRIDETGYNKYEQIGYRALKEYTDIIIKEKPDLVVNAGDIFDKPNPSILAMMKYSNMQNKLSKHNIPTMDILGNHDFSFSNKKNNCSAAAMSGHTYFADYDIKTVEIDGILFVMMPYIYDSKENIINYLQKCKDITRANNCAKKILVTHGITDYYYRTSLINDIFKLDDELVELFDLVIIGHIHTPFDYKQGKTLVLSPGAMIDYQAYEDRTGPIMLDTDTMQWHKIKVKTPHIEKIKCDETNINEVLSKVIENIYHIEYLGDVNKIDNDIFIKAKNTAVHIVIDVVAKEELLEEDSSTQTSKILTLYEWIADKYPDYVDIFNKARNEGGSM